MAMVQEFNRRLTGSCDVKRKPARKNVHGEVAGDPELVQLALACFVGSPSGRMNVAEWGLNPATTRVFYFAAGADVKVGDVLVYGGANYLARYLLPMQDHHLEVYVETVFGSK